jgi:hypothetical protein
MKRVLQTDYSKMSQEEGRKIEFLRWCLDYEQQCDEQEIVLTTQGKISD